MTDPKKKREPRELPVGEAIEKLTELQRWYDSGLEVALANARAKYTEEHTDKIERILSRVHPDARELVRAKATLPDTSAVNEVEPAASDLPRGAQPYHPGPVASAAARGRT